MTVASRRPTAVVVLACVAIAALAVAFIGVPLWNLVVPGPFDWHVQTDAYWQGGLEALALAALIAAAFAINRGVALWLLAVLPAVLFLRRHAVDLALLSDLLQFEICIGLGALLARMSRGERPRDSQGYLLAFVAGFALWSVCAWAASALGLGSVRQSGWLAVLLALAACCARQMPLSVHLFRRVREQSLGDRVWCALLGAWLLILFARARYALGFDSLWYGLRSAFVLAPGNSAYEPLGLTSAVYYFPKLYEVFLLPQNLVGDYAAIGGFTALLTIPLLLTCRLLLRELNTPARTQMPILALIATLPALANSATEAKPDVLATVFVVLAALLGLRAARRRSWPWLAWTLACIALACSAKITAIPFAGMVLIAAGARWCSGRIAPQDAPAPPALRHALGVFALAMLAAGFVLARTWLLAGVPTIGPDPLLKLWTLLGFSLREPAGSLNWARLQDWADVPALLVDWLFQPQAMEHIVISWTGNVWLWFALVVAIAAAAGWRRALPAPARAWTFTALIGIGLVLALGNRYMTRGGDGNYFLFALVPAIACSGSAAFARLLARPRAFAVALACVPAFVLFQASYSFASGAWVQGTRAFDMEFGHSPRATRKKRVDMLNRAGIAHIAELFADKPHGTRVSGLLESYPLFWLPACGEDFLSIAYSRPEYVRSSADIRHLLRVRGIRYVILPQDNPTTRKARQLFVFPSFLDVERELQTLPGVRRTDDARYYLLDLSAVDAATLDPPGNSAAAAPAPAQN